MTQLRIGVIGCGQWGWNHIRSFQSLKGCSVRRAADLSSERLAAIGELYPDIVTSPDPLEPVSADDVDAIVIATPTRTHHALARQSLQAGKHVLCEKPLTLDARDAEELVALAETRGLTFMVGHVFMYNPGILYLKEQIATGKLGSVYYLDAVRTNFGPVRPDVGAIYDLASHDISIFNFLLDSEPMEVSAQGECFIQQDREDVAFLVLEYPRKVLCHAHVSWLNPRKVRQLTVVGDKKMAVWDDMTPLEPVRLYDRGLQEKPYYDSFGQFQMILRDADITIPKVQMFEPLTREAQAFVDCIRGVGPFPTDGRSGVAVVRALEAAMRSMRNQGRRETIAIAKDAIR